MAEKVAGKKEEQRQKSNKKNNNNKSKPNAEKEDQHRKKEKPRQQWLVSPHTPAEFVKKKKQQQKKNGNSNTSTNTNANTGAGNRNKGVHFANNAKAPNKKSKERDQNKSQGSRNAKKGVNKPAGGICSCLFKWCLFTAASVALYLGFLYVVDLKKYQSVMKGGGNVIHTVSTYLPVGVVTQGEKVYLNFVRPMVDKVLVVVNQTSTALNTNPALKDHWSNINEISAVIGERLAEYMRTVYKHIPIYYDYAKNKLF